MFGARAIRTYCRNRKRGLKSRAAAYRIIMPPRVCRRTDSNRIMNVRGRLRARVLQKVTKLDLTASRDFYELLADVMALEHSNKRFWSVLKAFYDGFAVMYLPIAQPISQLPIGFFVAVGELPYQESLDPSLLD